MHYKPYARRATSRICWADPRVEMLAGDVRDAGRVMDAVEGCDTVFHLAALIGIPYSTTRRARTSRRTSSAPRTSRRRAGGTRVRRLVHTSTSEVYGTALTAPITEDHPLQPQSPYSASKIGADMMALSHWHAFELPVTVVRPFNTYGPRQSARAVIPTILAQLHSGARRSSWARSPRPGTSPTCTDTAARLPRAWRSATGRWARSVNLGSGREISIGDLARR